MVTLYHYTTPAGFEGILKSRGIWVTDTRFLNDRDEFKTGWEVFNEVFKSRGAHIQHQNLEAHGMISKIMEIIPEATAHVASFSQRGDMLSQWRGYNGGYGFSLGFDSQALNSASQAQGFEMGPVTYYQSEHLGAMHAKFDLLNNLLNEKDRPVGLSVIDWWQHILRLVAVIKNGHFNEEAEYRIYSGWTADNTGVQVRSTVKGLISYMQMQLDHVMQGHVPHGNLGLQEVIVGPAMSHNQAAAAKLLMKQYGFDAEVRMSSIPYIGT